MTMAGDDSEEAILVTFNEDVARKARGAVFLVLTGAALGVHHHIYKRMEVEFGILIVPMHVTRRHVRLVSMLSVVVVRSDEAGKDYQQVNDREQRHGKGQLALEECHRTRIRGSTAQSRRSATRFPRTRNNVDNITAPITRNKSRLIIASTNIGPIPGQLITTSIRSEALRSPAMERPNREIKGFAAARNAWLNRIRTVVTP